jgi:hypothetical protein
MANIVSNHIKEFWHDGEFVWLMGRAKCIFVGKLKKEITCGFNIRICLEKYRA